MKPRRRRTEWLCWLLVAAGTGAAARAADDPACIADVSVDRAEIVIGEQLVYRVRTFRRADVTSARWVVAPSFPGFRAEWLSEQPIDDSLLRGRHRYTAREERHALFPERAGVLSLQAPALRCVIGAGAGARASVVRVPTLTLRVHPLPPNAPPSFDGLVGPVALQILVTPREIRLGESVRVAVVMRGEGALWNARDPLGEVAGADVFRRRSEVATEVGRRLVVKRHFAYDVVPLRPGSLVLPGFQVPYYDPAGGRFDRATTAATTVTVGARRAGGDPKTAPPPMTGAAGGPDAEKLRAAGDTDARGLGWTGAAVAAVLLTLGALAATGARRRAAGRSSAAAEPDGAEAEALARALRSALTRHLPGTSTLTAEEIRGHPELPPRAVRAADLLVAVDRARFDPDAATPDRDSVGEAIASL